VIMFQHLFESDMEAVKDYQITWSRKRTDDVVRADDQLRWDIEIVPASGSTTGAESGISA
jgi:hypothetical protein